MTSIVTENAHQSRFEIHVDGELAGWVDYREHEGEYALPHTRVLPAFEGRGLGTELIRGALAQIAARGGTVLPYCPFVPRVIAMTDEFAELVPADRRAEFGL